MFFLVTVMSSQSSQANVRSDSLRASELRDTNDPTVKSGVKRMLAQFAIQDWFLALYLLVYFSAVWFAPPSEGRIMNLQRIGVLALCTLPVIAAVRTGLVRNAIIVPILYRAAVFAISVASYFMLKDLLPVVFTRALDKELYSLDLAVFGFEPAVWMDQFVNPYTTQWFSFFYYSYFIFISVYVLGFILFARNMTLLAEFTIAFMGTYCIAHLLYMAVPGYGPYRFLSHLFTNELPYVFWYARVRDVVDSAGAQIDIFPSLHTAGPTACFFFAVRHRKQKPFKYVWHITGFFAVNIIIATMFLRWHYVIDIVAGISLAGLMMYLATVLTPWEENFREKNGLQPVWPALIAPWIPKKGIPKKTS